MNKLSYLILTITLLTGLTSCNTDKPVKQEKEEVKETMMKFEDKHTYAKPQEAVITHLDWKANVDFETKTITATAIYKIKTTESASKIIFDTKDSLAISAVRVDGKPAKFEIGATDEFLGAPLTVELTKAAKQVEIDYKTNPNAAAVQWLSPQQTANKTTPFLFTQSQAILARSWFPIQDGPGIRFTYEAEVTVPKGMIALMSAENPTEKNETGTYNFSMKQPVPAYLMALTIGDVDYRKLGAHTGIYAESSLMEKAAYEFAEMEDMLVAAEKLYGKYQWEVYDMIILPPSFPFGGMENPRLTFATPTIIAGDRSLTALVAHELAHSWSGNLVTNATWDDFWLNEGFTVYFERRIMESLYGKDYAEMLAQLGYQDLLETVDGYMEGGQPKDTHLKLDLNDRNPDDGMSDIAYEKGYFFLRLVENTVGRAKFDVFLKDYFQGNAFKVMTTEAFIIHLKANLLDSMSYDSIGADQWIYGEGLPDNLPAPNSNKFELVNAQIEAWKSGTDAKKLATTDWSSHEWLHFIRTLPAGLSFDKMKELDAAFRFTKSGNSEVLAAWFQHTIKNNYVPANQVMKDFLVSVGRRKFLTPTYTALKESGKLAMAKEIYKEARPNYHSVSQQTMDELLDF